MKSPEISVVVNPGTKSITNAQDAKAGGGDGCIGRRPVASAITAKRAIQASKNTTGVAPIARGTATNISAKSTRLSGSFGMSAPVAVLPGCTARLAMSIEAVAGWVAHKADAG